jgi:hypothetical protein
MSTGTQKYDAPASDLEPRHSALEEFARDERRPAVLLLGALVIAAIFFALGIVFDRWTNNRNIHLASPPDSTQSPAKISGPGPATP